VIVVYLYQRLTGAYVQIPDPARLPLCRVSFYVQSPQQMLLKIVYFLTLRRLSPFLNMHALWLTNRPTKAHFLVLTHLTNVSLSQSMTSESSRRVMRSSSSSSSTCLPAASAFQHQDDTSSEWDTLDCCFTPFDRCPFAVCIRMLTFQRCARAFVVN
jgi:hypothetical protein